MTPSDLSRIEGLLEKATPGDWQDNAYTNGSGAFVEADEEGVILDTYGPLRESNAALIAALRNAAPELLALARRAMELTDALNYLHKNSPMSTSDFEPHAILMLAKQLGWSPTTKGEHG